MARLVEKFERLEEFYLVVDETDLGGRGLGEWRGDDVWGGIAKDGKVFEAYSRTYFSPDLSKAGVGVQESSEVLERIRANMVSTRRLPETDRVK
jgi:hypothetical protein